MQYEFDFKSAPHKDYTNVNWDTAIGVSKSKAGSQGVYFVATPDGALVVKGSMGIAAEVFGATLGRHLGILTQPSRVVHMGETDPTGEGVRMFNKLVELESKNPMSLVRSDLNTSYVSVSPFVTGKPLDECSYDDLSAMWGSPGRPSEKGKRHLQELGAFIGFDLLCHNMDRLPVCTANRGNAGNVMFSFQKGPLYGSVIGIDNAVCCVNPGQNREQMAEYVALVGRLLADIYRDPDAPAPDLARVRDFVLETCGFDIDFTEKSEESGGWRERLAAMDVNIKAKEAGGAVRKAAEPKPGTIEIQRGLVAFFNKIAAETKLSDLQAILAEISQGRPGMVGLDVVRDDYFAVMLQLIRDKGDLQGLRPDRYLRQVLATSQEYWAGRAETH